MFKKLVLTTAAIAAMTGTAWADYPERPIQVVVPYSAGGSTDLSMRIVADTFERLFDGTMVVRNQPGGGGGIGSSAALNARADGYTLGTGAQGPLVIKPLIGGTDYSFDDVEFIGLYARSLQVMVACADAPFNDYDEMIAYAAESPIQVGNSGAGGANQISAEAFAARAEIAIESVPFNGSSEARTACIGGHIDAMVASPAEAKAASDAGQMTPIFVMEDERIDLFPDTPTAVEKGVDFTWSSWKGVIAPKGLDEEVLAFLRDAVEQIANDEEFRQQLTDMGELVVYEGPEEFEARARSELETSEQVLENLGMLGMNN
ncbi:Bug family tripartite tricarboxylate transporter substrate binding protein [Paracoccaceae bacterium GXU_MW_L88]